MRMRFRVGLSMIALYAKEQSTTRKSIVFETCLRFTPTVIGRVTMPFGLILLPVKPTSGASMGCNLSLFIFICWKAGRYRMSAELPLLIKTLQVVNPAMSMVNTRASSCLPH